MTKNEFIAWLEGYEEGFEPDIYIEKEIFQVIKMKAKELEDTYPVYPGPFYPIYPISVPSYPTYPWITYISDETTTCAEDWRVTKLENNDFEITYS
jgi:hypothetical protein